MITKKTRGTKKVKTVVSSSYFDDIKMIEEGERETKAANYIPRWERSKQNQMRSLGELQLANAVLKIQLAKKGCREVLDFEAKIPENKKADYIFNYGPCKEYRSYEDLQADRQELLDELATEKDPEAKAVIQQDIDAIEKEIKSIDDFVERNMEAVMADESQEA